jgi:hypothetical protein
VRRALSRSKARGRSAGLTPVANVLEGALSIGFFVVLIIGEKALSTGIGARRDVEDAADESATLSGAAYCETNSPSDTRASIDPSTVTSSHPNTQAATSFVSAIGIGQEKPFSYYTDQMQHVVVTGREAASLRVRPNAGTTEATYRANRSLGCAERPKDKPCSGDKCGSEDDYRTHYWTTKVMGYK